MSAAGVFDLALVRALPADLPPPRVSARVSIVGEGTEARLRVDYTIANSKLNARQSHPRDKAVWGLWDNDVCELFLSASHDESTAKADASYFEFQVSPFAQWFELKIIEPRVKFEEGFRSGFAQGATVRTTQAWSAWMEIPLATLNLDAQKPLYGNLCACLLREPHRAYLAAGHEKNSPPDFHRRVQFLRLWG